VSTSLYLNGTAAEPVVCDAIRRLGWACELFGTRHGGPREKGGWDLLDGLPWPEPAKFLPDLVARRGNDLRWVDVKTVTRSKYQNASVFKDAHQAHLDQLFMNWHPILYVMWPHQVAAYVHEVDRVRRQGPSSPNGSGRDYWLFPLSSFRPLAEVFR